MPTNNRAYCRRNVGDIVNGAELVEKMDARLWKMRCQCGNFFVSQPSETSGRCRECAYKVRAASRTKHGEAPKQGRKNATRLYNIWSNMRARCNNSKKPDYQHYGGRGVNVCPEWKDYINFKAWALENGYSDDLEIDRIDNNGNYEPNNCRWTTRSVQNKNRRKMEYKYGRDEHGRFLPKGVAV